MNAVIIFCAKYLIFILIIGALGFFVKKYGENQKKVVALAMIVLPLSYVLAKILSVFFFGPRPFVSDQIIPLFPHAADNGFPSDHMLLSSAIAATVFAFDRKFGSLLLIGAIFVGGSRVLAGVHHWADIFGSLGIVVVSSFIAYKYILPYLLESKVYKKFF